MSRRWAQAWKEGSIHTGSLAAAWRMVAIILVGSAAAIALLLRGCSGRDCQQLAADATALRARRPTRQAQRPDSGGPDRSPGGRALPRDSAAAPRRAVLFGR